MTLNLPPDPYKVLGVLKDAKLPEIRSAHRKLVLKCHPDKVQDAALKAVKQDEFQKVQQAYELLSDDTKRIQYDEQVKLFALRAEMGRGNPTARSNPFEYEIKTAEPRANTYSRPTPTAHDAGYSSYPPSRSHDEVYEERYRTAKKSASYESDKRRPTTRDGERERSYRSDEREREKWEKESKRAAHGEKKKSRDKERRRGTEEKTHTRTQPYIEDDSDDYRAPPRERKSERRRVEEEVRYVDKTRDSPLHSKWDDHKEFAAHYMQAARRKVASERVETEFIPPPIRRTTTYAGPEIKYNVQHVSPKHTSPQVQTYHFAHLDEEDSPRRSSARTSRRSSETPEHRSSKEPSKKEHRRDGVTIVEPPSPHSPSLSQMRSPKLPSHSSAPGGLAAMVREAPSRSKTQDYPRSQERSMPPLPRASTFQSGDRDHARSGGSRLRQRVDYDEQDDSDSSPIAYVRSPRLSNSPPPRRDSHKSTKQTKYVINDSKATPVTRHRPDLRDVDDEVYVATRDRSESPRSSRRSERPPLVARASSSSRQAPQRSHSKSFYPEVPEPVIREVRPGMPARGSPHISGRSPTDKVYFGEIPTPSKSKGYQDIQFAPQYTAENVLYSPYIGPKDPYRRGSEPSHPHRDYPHSRSGPGQVYA